jgi:hypothetical protein
VDRTIRVVAVAVGIVFTPLLAGSLPASFRK